MMRAGLLSCADIERNSVCATAITKGLNRGKKYYPLMYAASILLVFMVQVINVVGSRLTKKKDHRLR